MRRKVLMHPVNFTRMNKEEIKTPERATWKKPRLLLKFYINRQQQVNGARFILPPTSYTLQKLRTIPLFDPR